MGQLVKTATLGTRGGDLGEIIWLRSSLIQEVLVAAQSRPVSDRFSAERAEWGVASLREPWTKFRMVQRDTCLGTSVLKRYDSLRWFR